METTQEYFSKLKLVKGGGYRVGTQVVKKGETIEVPNDEVGRLTMFGRFVIVDDSNIPIAIEKAEKVPERGLGKYFAGQRVAVQYHGGLGDVLIGGCVVNKLKDGNCFVGMVVPENVVELAEIMEGVDEVLTFRQYSRIVTLDKYDREVSLSGGLLKNSRHVVGTDYYRRTLQQAELGGSVALPRFRIKDFDKEVARRTAPENPFVVFHTGASNELRRWEDHQWVKLAEFLAEKNVAVVFVGKQNFGYAEGDLIKDCRYLPLAQQVVLVQLADYFVGTDSFFCHVAGISKLPGLILFGVSNPEAVLYHYSTLEPAISKENLECRPCLRLKEDCPIEKRCMTGISVDDIKRRIPRELWDRKIERKKESASIIETRHLRKPSRDKLRLLSLTPSLILGGAEVATAHLMRLLKDDYDILMAGVVYDSRPDTTDFGKRLADSKKYKQFGQDGFNDLVRYIKRIDPDIILYYAFDSFIPDVIRKLVPRPVVIRTRHGETEKEFELISRALDVTDEIVCVSPQQARYHHSIFIPNSFDSEKMNTEEVHDFKWEYPNPTMGYIGRVDDAKGISLLFEELLVEFQKHVNIAVVGFLPNVGQKKRGYEARMKLNKGDKKKVRLVDATNDPASYFRAFDLHVLLSRSEAFPLTILEAAYCGVPTVMTPVGAAVELFEDDKTIFFVKDEQELLQRLPYILKRRFEVGENARELIEREYNEDIMVRRYKDVLEEAVKKRLELLNA